MTSFQIIKELCTKNGLSISTLESELGYGNGSLSKAKIIPSDRIYTIAKRFNVTMEYLMGEIDDSPKTVAAHIDTEDLSRDELDDVTEYIEFIRNRRK